MKYFPAFLTVTHANIAAEYLRIADLYPDELKYSVLAFLFTAFAAFYLCATIKEFTK